MPYKDIEKRRAAQRRYNMKPQAKRARNRWEKSKKGKTWRKKQNATYNKTKRGKASIKAWQLRRRKWLNDLKLESGCVDCGYRKHYAALDFDHVRGRKLLLVSQSVTCSMKRLLKEIAKCEVRCANCHRVKTMERRG